MYTLTNQQVKTKITNYVMIGGFVKLNTDGLKNLFKTYFKKRCL